MKIKLRDLTYEQYREWNEKNNCSIKKCRECPFDKVYCEASEASEICWVKNKDLYSETFLNQEIEVEGEILTESEREYLSTVIKPFRNSVGYIAKIPIKEIKKAEFIQIGYNGEWFSLPPFEPGEYYENMELYKKYTLEELGL